MERLNRMSGARAVVVSHEGGGDQMIGVLNGTYDLGIGEIQELRAQIEARKLRLLAALTEKRLPGGFSDLPTAREQGVDLVVTKFRGLAGPKKLPAGVLKAWEQGLEARARRPGLPAGIRAREPGPGVHGPSRGRPLHHALRRRARGVAARARNRALACAATSFARRSGCRSPPRTGSRRMRCPRASCPTPSAPAGSPRRLRRCWLSFRFSSASADCVATPAFRRQGTMLARSSSRSSDSPTSCLCPSSATSSAIALLACGAALHYGAPRRPAVALFGVGTAVVLWLVFGVLLGIALP